MLFRLRLLLLAIALACASFAQKHYVVMVSLDGFRYDYADRYAAPNINAIREEGAAATALIPCFPSVTFSNHLSIITGLYPEHHGIVMNRFYDPLRDAEYSNSKTATDGTWYSGKPLWVLAEEQNVKSAAMFWPGSDAEIGGVRPSYWFPYDGSVSDEERVNRVLEWLKLPEAARPHFITLYFSDVDTAGHHFGPDSSEVRQAVAKVDEMVGKLRLGVRATSLPVDLLLVSDHGMQAVKGTVNLNNFVDLSGVRIINEGPFAMIYASDKSSAERIYKSLKGKSPDFDVYRRVETPKEWHYRDNPRAGDIFVLLNKPMAFITTPSAREPDEGRHGYDPARFESMRGVFYAVGPKVKPKTVIEPFVNVDIYPFVAKILGLRITDRIDGSAKVLERIYKP